MQGYVAIQELAPGDTGLRAFGLSLSVDGPLPPGAWEVQWPQEPRPATGPGPTEPRLRLQMSTPEAIAESWSGFDEIGWEASIDGTSFVVERGVEGDYRFVHGTPPGQSGGYSDGTLAVHHLSADASVLQCAPSNPADPSWWRVVLDSVLFTVALLHGYEALHAGAVATPDGVIAITAASGGGKSTLLIELLRRGLPLMADDVLILEPQGMTKPPIESRATEPPLTYPGPPLMTIPAARIPVPRKMSAAGETDSPETTNPPETICALEDERWIAVPTHPTPLPLKALVVLDRRPESHLLLHKIDDPLAPLMGSLMNFPRTPERQRTRFELASALASKTALWRLTADLETPPDVLADTLLEGVL